MQRHESIPRLVTTLASAKSDPSYRHAALVGLAMDVALRLKDPKGHLNVGKGYVEELKPIVNDLYLNSVVTSKTVPPSHVLGALSDFFAATVTIDDATSTFIPAMEKALNRAAEPALTILRSFFAALPPSVSSDPTLRQKLAPAILTSAKSSSAPTRAASIRLFSTLYSSGSEEDLLPVAEQVYTPVRTGKTTFVDHRVALYTMLASLPPSPKLSAEIVTTALTALPKETNENTVSAVSQVLSAHLPAVLLADTAVPAPQIAALVKGMADTKPAIRRLVQATVGNVFWVLKESGKEATQAEKAFATGLLPGFEASLKIVTTNMLNSPSGPLEGYVAVAVLKSRASKWGVKKIDDLVNSNAAMQRLGQTGAKPNFFLYDKVYRKASSVEDGVWLARALEAFFDADEDKLAKDETLRANFAAALLHLITEGASHDIRAEAVGFVRKACARSPKLVHLALRDGMRAWLVQSEKAKAVAKPTAEDAEAPLDRAPRLRAVLSALASFDDEVDQQTREDLLVQLVVLAHYPRLSKSEASLWVDLLLIAKVSPDKVIAERLSELIDLVLADASLTPAVCSCCSTLLDD